ncbi:unnamed protein product [Paramecium primaurelia]|uniref:Uncharacterized protein n=1 Tax=Paramecium primaurelia TaxID=5886 RepID=A0A8S1PH30_PARPR|nr:unnamed protein product [Paramecium primaurelia]
MSNQNLANPCVSELTDSFISREMQQTQKIFQTNIRNIIIFKQNRMFTSYALLIIAFTQEQLKQLESNKKLYPMICLN